MHVYLGDNRPVQVGLTPRSVQKMFYLVQALGEKLSRLEDLSLH